MSTIEAFAADVVSRVAPALDAQAAAVLQGDLAAGEFEVAAISAVEAAPQIVTDGQVNELERLSEDFDSVDRAVAQRVIAKYRAQRAA